MVSIGLLMISVTSATSLAEERRTWQPRPPVDDASVGACHRAGQVAGHVSRRQAPRCIAGHPCVFVGASFRADLGGHVAAVDRCLGSRIRSAITSLGQFLALRQRRLGRAVGFSVAVYLALTVIYPAVMIVSGAMRGPGNLLILCVSPFFAMYAPVAWSIWFRPFVGVGEVVGLLIWALVLAAVSSFLFRATLRSFDRRLGRVPSAEEADSAGRNARPRRRATAAMIAKEV